MELNTSDDVSTHHGWPIWLRQGLYTFNIEISLFLLVFVFTNTFRVWNGPKKSLVVQYLQRNQHSRVVLDLVLYVYFKRKHFHKLLYVLKVCFYIVTCNTICLHKHVLDNCMCTLFKTKQYTNHSDDRGIFVYICKSYNISTRR